jgi:hypothetical protein
MNGVEDGSFAGPGLSVFQTVATFVVIPVSLFLLIAGISWISTSPRKKKVRSSITTID